MLNIGNRPTVNGTQKTVEANLFDFQGDLYDKQITIYLKAFLRDERKFDGLEALKEQLFLDQKNAKNLL